MCDVLEVNPEIMQDGEKKYTSHWGTDNDILDIAFASFVYYIF